MKYFRRLLNLFNKELQVKWAKIAKIKKEIKLLKKVKNYLGQSSWEYNLNNNFK